MNSFISADYLYPITTPPIKNGVLELDENGRIEAVLSSAEAEKLGVRMIKYFSGVLIPGFINTHCHLELSHLRGKINEKTGLPGFIKQVLALRQQPDEEILEAMRVADQEMFDNGIVAVGDIANLISSKTIKLKSKLYYQTFIELLGFNNPSAPIIKAGIKLREDFSPLKASIVPHAPYSVSAELFAEIAKITRANDVLSIHSQETQGETDLFENGNGTFAEFFSAVGIAQSEAHNSGKNSIYYHLPKMPKHVNTLLVHNTMVSKADLDFAKKAHQNLYWCLCPNANLYIENTLPNVDLLKSEQLVLTLGTDSLASNRQLNILSEMKILQNQKDVRFDESIKWATLNGAQYLGIDEQLGSFEVGKTPGVVLLELGEDLVIKDETKIKRIF